MTGANGKVAGFALGALLDGDRDATAVADHVAPSFLAAVRACLAEVGSAPGKRNALALLVGRVRPEPDPDMLARLPSRARNLLRSGRRRRGTPATQANCAIDPDLVALLRRLAARCAP